MVGFNPEGALPPIFAIPGGGGTALAFRSLAGALGTDQPLYVIEPLGLHQPHRPDLTVPALARSARLEIDRRHAHGAPVVVIGYSAGASAAYEIVRQLEQEGRSARLVLLDAAPGRAGRYGLGAPPAAPRPGHGSIPSPLARLRRRTRTRLVLDMPTMAVRWAGRTLTPTCQRARHGPALAPQRWLTSNRCTSASLRNCITPSVTGPLPICLRSRAKSWLLIHGSRSPCIGMRCITRCM